MDLQTMPIVVGIALTAAVGLVFGWRTFQRCPDCGALVRRVARGWKRCKRCGRQYRKGLRLR